MYRCFMNGSFCVVNDYFASSGDSFHNYASGWCGPLTHAVSAWLKQRGVEHKRLLIVRGSDGKYLKPTVANQPETIWYHAIIVVDGVIHCPWLNERLDIKSYCDKMFPGQEVIIGENYNRFTAKEELN